MLVNQSPIPSRLTTNTATHTTLIVTTASSTALAANASRTWFMIQNLSAVDMYFSFSGSATTSNGIKLVPNASFFGTADLNYTGQVTITAVSGTTNNARVIEAAT